MAASDVREYRVEARSTETFGRVLCSARDQHFVVDGPVQNGCPGEAITPAELFLSSVAACGAELVQVIAKQQEVPLQTIDVSIKGIQDRGNPARSARRRAEPSRRRVAPQRCSRGADRA